MLKFKTGGLLEHWILNYSYVSNVEYEIKNFCDLTGALLFCVIATLIAIIVGSLLSYVVVFGVVGWIAGLTGAFDISLLEEYFSVPIVVTFVSFLFFVLFVLCDVIPKIYRKLKKCTNRVSSNPENKRLQNVKAVMSGYKMKYKEKFCPMVEWEK